MSSKVSPLKVTVLPQIDPEAVVNPGKQKNGITQLEEAALTSHGFAVREVDPALYGRPMVEIVHNGQPPRASYVHERALKTGPDWLADLVRERAQPIPSEELIARGKGSTAEVDTVPCTKYQINAATLGLQTEDLLQGILKRISDPRYSLMAVHVEQLYTGSKQLDRLPEPETILVSRTQTRRLSKSENPEQAFANAVHNLVSEQMARTADHSPQFEIFAAADDLDTLVENKPKVSPTGHEHRVG